jgi:acetyl-CoA C-acetyltransferase
MLNDPIVIVSAKRTAMGHFGGAFKNTSASTLGAASIRACLTESGMSPNDVDRVLMGCVLQAGQGQAPARQATLNAGLANSTPATTVNKMCGSGLETVIMAHDALAANSQQVVIAGGMECMSQAPYLLAKERFGARLGHQKTLDHMFLDGLEDAYDKGKLMGHFADQTAAHYQISREQQDAWALSSLERACNAQKDGKFAAEITPVDVTERKKTQRISEDEGPQNAKPEKIPQLKPAFNPDGTVTAANASSISDGASAVLLMRQSEAKKRQLPILATIIAHSAHAEAPEWFTRAPVGAINKLLKAANWGIETVDLWEINEAFAVVTLLAIQSLKLNPNQVNIHGGACALGHPIGASGTRILTSLIYALKQQDKKRGIASLCIGGGEALAVAIQIGEP